MSGLSNVASSVGQKVGRIFENAIFRYLQPRVVECGGSVRTEELVNGDDSKYRVDQAIRNSKGELVALIETKFIRYKKHNRDKGSWIVSTHKNLRRSHPTIKSCFALLSGRWSTPSLEFMSKSGVVVSVVDFETIADVFERHGVVIRWEERGDEQLQLQAHRALTNITDAEKEQIGDEMISGILPDLDKILAILQ